MFAPAFDQRPIAIQWVGGSNLIFIRLSAETQAVEYHVTVDIPLVGSFNVADDKKKFSDGTSVTLDYGDITSAMLSHLYAWSYSPIVDSDSGGEGSLDTTNIGNLVVINWTRIKSKFGSLNPVITVSGDATILDHPITVTSGGYGVSDIGSWGTFAPGDGTHASFDLWFTSGATNTNVKSTSPALVISGSETLDGALAMAAAYEAANPGHTAVVSASTTGPDPIEEHTTHHWESFTGSANVEVYTKTKHATVGTDNNYFADEDVIGYAGSTTGGNDAGGDAPTEASFTTVFTLAPDLMTGTP